MADLQALHKHEAKAEGRVVNNVANVSRSARQNLMYQEQQPVFFFFLLWPQALKKTVNTLAYHSPSIGSYDVIAQNQTKNRVHTKIVLKSH